MLEEKVSVVRSDTEVVGSESWREQQLISKEREACITAMSGGEKVDDFAQNEYSEIKTRLDIGTYLMEVT